MAKAKKTPAQKRAIARKRNIAKQRQTACGRLADDGASSLLRINRRLQWLMQEWQLPRCPKIGREPSAALRDYIEAHNISWDWFYCGDLKGLRRMMQWRKYSTAKADLRGRVIERIVQQCGQVTAEQRRIVDEEIRRMLAEREGEPA